MCGCGTSCGCDTSCVGVVFGMSVCGRGRTGLIRSLANWGSIFLHVIHGS